MENKNDFDPAYAAAYGRKLFGGAPDTIGQAYVVQAMRAQWERDSKIIKTLQNKLDLAIKELKDHEATAYCSLGTTDTLKQIAEIK